MHKSLKAHFESEVMVKKMKNTHIRIRLSSKIA